METVPAGWQLTSATCSDGSPPNALVLGLGETVTCTFTNTADGTLIIRKETIPDGSEQGFGFSGGEEGLLLHDYSATGEQLLISGQPGVYTSAETVPEGWVVTDISCEGAIDSTVTIGGAGGFDPGDQGVSIDPVAGEDITCVFFNDADGSITLVKNLPNDDGGNAVASDTP